MSAAEEAIRNKRQPWVTGLSKSYECPLCRENHSSVDCPVVVTREPNEEHGDG